MCEGTCEQSVTTLVVSLVFLMILSGKMSSMQLGKYTLNNWLTSWAQGCSKWGYVQVADRH